MIVTPEEQLKRARHTMVDRLVESRGIRDPRVLHAMRCVPRHLFVDTTLESKAYGPYILPIGCGQSLPHPYTVATMLGALRLQGDESVLEIGAGSGYATAALAMLAASVESTERIATLWGQAQERMAALHITNVRILNTSSLMPSVDATFDAIYVGTAVPEVPGSLLAQLKDPGRLIIPVGRPPHQRLLLLTRRGDEVRTQRRGTTRFATMSGDADADPR